MVGLVVLRKKIFNRWISLINKYENTFVLANNQKKVSPTFFTFAKTIAFRFVGYTLFTYFAFPLLY